MKINIFDRANAKPEYSSNKAISSLILSAVLIMTLNLNGCGPGIREPSNITEKKIKSRELRISNSKIDGYKSFELYFSINKDIEMMMISITAAGAPELITEKHRIIKAYFILEKIVDLSHFKNQKQPVANVELGRNFNDRWNRQNEISVRTTAENPMKSLSRGQSFRLRFTTFTDEEAEFSIKIKCDSSVTFR